MKILDVPQSGSVAGGVSSRNRFGQYRRTRAIPVQPRSGSVMAQRASLADLSAAWRGLSDAQRLAWRALADSVPLHNSLGATITLTGHQMFVRVNRNRAIVHKATALDAPVQPAFSDSVFDDITDLDDAPTFTVAVEAIADPLVLVIEASPQLSAGRSFNAVFRHVANFGSGIAATDADILPQYRALFGAPVAGKRIFLRASQDINGFRDTPVLISRVVAHV